MNVKDLEKMTEAEIIEAATMAVQDARSGMPLPFIALCQVAIANDPNFTDKQKLLADALSREEQHGRIIHAVESAPRLYRTYRSRPSGG